MSALHFLDEHTTVALDELTQASGLATSDIVELVEFGVFEPLPSREQWRFSARCIVRARQAARLRRDFQLDSAALAVALAYLDRIESLEQQVRELECQLLR